MGEGSGRPSCPLGVVYGVRFGSFMSLEMS